MIFLIRHGEAAAGWGEAADPGLSDLGHRQAGAAAERLIAAGATSAITSPMKRCRETSDAFERAAGITARIEPRVSEIETPPGLDDRSAWLGAVMAGRWDNAGDALQPWRRATLEAVTDLPDGAAVFSHFVAINAIVGLLDDEASVLVFRPTHCSITRLERTPDGLRVIERGGEAETRVL